MRMSAQMMRQVSAGQAGREAAAAAAATTLCASIDRVLQAVRNILNVVNGRSDIVVTEQGALSRTERRAEHRAREAAND